MKSVQKIFIASILISFALFISGCSKNDDSEPEYATITLDHFNVIDFSGGTDGDGYTTSWQPDNGTHPSYANHGDYLWWTTSSSAGNVNATKDMGMVDMSSITQAPSTWEIAPNITPLLVGHVYVAKCADGYVKFKVTSVDPASNNWEAVVDYYFSETSTFNE